MKIGCILVFIFIILCYGLCEKDNNIEKKSDSNPNYGPFYSTVVRFEACGLVYKPTRPYDKNPVTMFYVEIYNTSDKINLIRGNTTVVRQSPLNNKFRIRGYQWKEGKWKIKYSLNNIACDGLLFSSLTRVFGLKDGCHFPKGVYPFKDLDCNQLDHFLWSSSRSYGRQLWITEHYLGQKTQFCSEIEMVVTPA